MGKAKCGESSMVCYMLPVVCCFWACTNPHLSLKLSKLRWVLSKHSLIGCNSSGVYTWVQDKEPQACVAFDPLFITEWLLTHFLSLSGCWLICHHWVAVDPPFITEDRAKQTPIKMCCSCHISLKQRKSTRACCSQSNAKARCEGHNTKLTSPTRDPSVSGIDPLFLCVVCVHGCTCPISVNSVWLLSRTILGWTDQGLTSHTKDPNRCKKVFCSFTLLFIWSVPVVTVMVRKFVQQGANMNCPGEMLSHIAKLSVCTMWCACSLEWPTMKHCNTLHTTHI